MRDSKPNCFICFILIALLNKLSRVLAKRHLTALVKSSVWLTSDLFHLTIKGNKYNVHCQILKFHWRRGGHGVRKKLNNIKNSFNTHMHVIIVISIEFPLKIFIYLLVKFWNCLKYLQCIYSYLKKKGVCVLHVVSCVWQYIFLSLPSLKDYYSNN